MTIWERRHRKIAPRGGDTPDASSPPVPLSAMRRGGTKANTPSVVIPRLQEVDAIVADEVDDPVLGREPATPHVRPEVFQRFRLADPTERVAHDRLDDRQRAAGRARISRDPPREVVAELRLEDRDSPTAT